MDSKNENSSVISQLSVAINELSLKMENLKTKLDILCKETGGCGNIAKVNNDLLRASAQKEIIDGTNINPLCKEK